jgi:hypothetical protein
MPRLIALAVLSAVLGAVAAAAETNEPAKEPKEAKEAKEAKEPAERALPPWTLKDWYRTSNLAQLRSEVREVATPQGKTRVQVEVLFLDALREKGGRVAVFRRDPAYVDPKVSAEFRVEPAGIGTRAVGLIVGSLDSGDYHALEITRTEAILYRAEAGKDRVVLARRGGLTRPEGVWQTAALDCSGHLLRVFFNNRLLFTAESRALKPGLVGAYAAQGRAEVILTCNGRATRLAVPWQLHEEPAKQETPKPEPGQETKKE